MTVLMKNPNFLILDEPTNDLDIVTLNVLEDYLQSFRGCLMIVSHDRFFMDKLVDHLFIFEGDGEIYDFPGNYSDFRVSQKLQEQEEAKLRAEAATKKVQDEKQSKPVSKDDRKKLSYKEQKELEQLEKDLETLEAEKTALENQMNSGVLAPDDLVAKSHRIGDVLRLIDEKTDRWLELSS